MKSNTNNIPGLFFENLNRNNSKIRADRAIAISEDAELTYRRSIEDLEANMKRCVRERESMLDLSPADANSLILALDFNGAEFVKRDVELGLKIRDLEIRLQIAKSRYATLFQAEETRPELTDEA